MVVVSHGARYAALVRPLIGALREKYFDKWLPGYARHLARQALPRPRVSGPRHLLFAITDHYEPLWGNVDDARGTQRVQTWLDGYPKMADQYRDADGKTPRYSWFFPGEQYKEHYLDPLAQLARRGYGEVEVHLHHDGDTAASLEAQLVETLANFAKHGHMTRDKDGRIRYGFIHGNWALANARSDGRWCGVDAEVPLLFKTGCYADFTFPAVPDECQPNKVNQIYWPTGDLAERRCYEHGVRARVGEKMDDRLLMITGPLAFSRRERGRVPVRIEASALQAHDPADATRIKTWARQNIHVEGRPEWVFCKVHTHGAPDHEGASLLGKGGHELNRILTSQYNDGKKWMLHYVTAREMFNIAIAAMDGKSGNPNDFRDYVLPPPPVAQG